MTDFLRRAGSGTRHSSRSYRFPRRETSGHTPTMISRPAAWCWRATRKRLLSIVRPSNRDRTRSLSERARCVHRHNIAVTSSMACLTLRAGRAEEGDSEDLPINIRRRRRPTSGRAARTRLRPDTDLSIHSMTAFCSAPTHPTNVVTPLCSFRRCRHCCSTPPTICSTAATFPERTDSKVHVLGCLRLKDDLRRLDSPAKPVCMSEIS